MSNRTRRSFRFPERGVRSSAIGDWFGVSGLKRLVGGANALAREMSRKLTENNVRCGGRTRSALLTQVLNHGFLLHHPVRRHQRRAIADLLVISTEHCPKTWYLPWEMRLYTVPARH